MADIDAGFIQDQFDIDEKLLDEYESQIKRVTAEYADEVKLALEDALSDLMLDSEGVIKPAGRNHVILEDAERNIQRLLEDAGLNNMTDDILATMDERLSTMNDLVENVGLEAAVISDFEQLPAINDRIKSVASRIANGKDVIADQVRGEIFRFRNDLQKSTKVRFGNVVDVLERKAGILPSYSKTVARTELVAVDRTARNLQADRAGIDRFKYMGVLDGATRPFCRQMRHKIKSREEWRAMQNNVGPQPVLTYCGGWNCRHRLMMWKKEWSKSA